jgi:hypothetical protein
MAIMTYSPFFGDTVFAFVARVIWTLVGAVIGMLLWYCSYCCMMFLCSNYFTGTLGPEAVRATHMVLQPLVQFFL